MLLASELYHRERGTLPPSEDALVGTYLESLPDDGSAELGDETTPTVSDSASSAQIQSNAQGPGVNEAVPPRSICRERIK